MGVKAINRDKNERRREEAERGGGEAAAAAATGVTVISRWAGEQGGPVQVNN